MIEAYSDRSRILTGHLCPRKRYFEYEINTPGAVNGVRPVRLNMDFLLGSTFHVGIEYLLRAMMEDRYNPGLTVDFAVAVALEGDEDYHWPGMWPKMRSEGLIIGEKEDAHYVYHEQAALAEALIRGYNEFVLPQIITRFDVVEVENDEAADFKSNDGQFLLHWGMRGDALLMEKETKDLYILSLKTTKEWGKRDEDSARHDMQGLSETASVDQRLLRWHKQLDTAKADSTAPGPGTLGIPLWFVDRYLEGHAPQVMGVKMEFALKGRRSESPIGSGKYYYSNPLIRPWKKSDDLGRDQYAVAYEYQDEMGGNHRLGKGWNRINIWEEDMGVSSDWMIRTDNVFGVAEWITYLKQHDVQGLGIGWAVEKQFVLPVEYYRNEEDMERWKRQIIPHERRMAESRNGLQHLLTKGSTAEELEAYLDEHYEMHTKSCDWPTKCEFQEVCFGPKAYLFDPMGSGLYTIREANHKIEEKLSGKSISSSV